MRLFLWFSNTVLQLESFTHFTWKSLNSLQTCIFFSASITKELLFSSVWKSLKKQYFLKSKFWPVFGAKIQSEDFSSFLNTSFLGLKDFNSIGWKRNEVTKSDLLKGTEEENKRINRVKKCNAADKMSCSRPIKV